MTDDIKAIRYALTWHVRTLRLAGRNDGMTEDMERAARLLDALEQASKDAERYRWLRDDPPLSLAVRRHPGETEAGCYLDGYNLDKAIDAAMSDAPGA